MRWLAVCLLAAATGAGAQPYPVDCGPAWNGCGPAGGITTSTTTTSTTTTTTTAAPTTTTTTAAATTSTT